MAARQLNQPPAVVVAPSAAKVPAKAVKSAAAEKPEVVPVPEEDDYSGGYGVEEAVPFPEDEFSSSGPAAAVQPAAQEAAAPVSRPLPLVEPAAPAPAAPVVKAAVPAHHKAPATPASAARPVESAAYQDVWKKMCAILDKEKKKAVLSCIRNGRVVYIGEGQVIVAFKTAFMVKRANREDYFKFTDAALSQILGSTYHMQGFLEGDAELSEYEKKKSDLPPVKAVEPASVQPEDIPVPAPAQEVGEPGDETAWQPASLDDMDEAERAALEPLLKNVGDCNIYIENKK